jgi:Family of unknown function (DUF5706)
VAGEEVVQALKDALARGDTALGRTETKTSILLGVFSPVLTVGIALLPKATLPTAAAIAFWLAIVLLAAALLLLLWNVRPRLRDSGFTTYAGMSDDEFAERIKFLAEHAERWYRGQLLVVARLGRTKFRLLAWATNLIIGALVFALLAAAITAL